jgi:hypothetical protein
LCKLNQIIVFFEYLKLKAATVGYTVSISGGNTGCYYLDFSLLSSVVWAYTGIKAFLNDDYFLSHSYKFITHPNVESCLVL